MRHSFRAWLFGLLFIFSIFYLVGYFWLDQQSSKDVRVACPSVEPRPQPARVAANPLSDSKVPNFIQCNINNAFTVGCYKDQIEQYPYIPFSLLIKLYEISGSFAKSSNSINKQFNWYHHSLSPESVQFIINLIKNNTEKYSHKGVFLKGLFDTYNVEKRAKVKYISAQTGVPISVQWKKSGHYYPIQVAQFGITHFCKYNSHRNLKQKLLISGDSIKGWHLPSPTSIVKSVTGPYGDVIAFSTQVEAKDSGLLFNLYSNRSWPEFCMTVFFEDQHTDVAVKLRLSPHDMFFIHFKPGVESDFRVTDHHMYFGVGEPGIWRTICRNVHADFFRANIPNTKVHRLLQLVIKGKGQIDNVTVGEGFHLHYFKVAADWLVNHQDFNGGFSINVQRSFSSSVVIKPPWYSAMAQGQSISLLSRAYWQTNDIRYYNAAQRALGLFDVLSHDNGFKAFFHENVWFEEYPTEPPSLVLNGFMFALLGLYDASKLPSNFSSKPAKAEQLFNKGVTSLVKMLPYYDTGFRSLYDLRHITMLHPPRIASWSYHLTHLHQLFALSTVTSGEIKEKITVILKRWLGYTYGDTMQWTAASAMNF